MGTALATKEIDINTKFNTWGNSLAVRISKAVAQIAGAEDGAPIHIHAEPGRITIEIEKRRMTLEERLASFDIAKHGGEVMAFNPVGQEKI